MRNSQELVNCASDRFPEVRIIAGNYTPKQRTGRSVHQRKIRRSFSGFLKLWLRGRVEAPRVLVSCGNPCERRVPQSREGITLHVKRLAGGQPRDPSMHRSLERCGGALECQVTIIFPNPGAATKFTLSLVLLTG